MVAAVRGNSWFFRAGLGTHHLDDHDQVFCIVFGSPGDIPVTGDWDDDGTGTFAVARAGFHDACFVTNVFDRGTAEYPMIYGNNGDRPVSWQ